MEKTNELSLWEVMYIGLNLEFLCNVTARTRLNSAHSDQIGIVDQLRILQQDLERLELSQSERVLSTNLDELLKYIEGDNHSSVLGRNAARKVRDIAREVKRFLYKEGIERTVFVTLRDRQGQIVGLLRDPVHFLV